VSGFNQESGMSSPLLSEKYQIQEEIGRGGMGVIYKALHTSLNRPVAIKVLHPQYGADGAFLKRFQREARAMARLDHENIIRVFDVEENQGTYYIVMEFFPGRNLKQLILEKGKLSPLESLSIALQTSEALSYAHSHGIIHRDIKPGNILIDSLGRVKIADLGVAAATDEISVTSAGEILGTPAYMSPEQAKGEHLDGRSDLYSLGMVLYEMLTGATLFEGISRTSIIGRLMYEKEEFTLSFPPDVPPSLQELVRYLLKKQPQDRIPDANHLIDQIKRIAQEMESDLLAPPAGETTATFPVVSPGPEKSPTDPFRTPPPFTSGPPSALPPPPPGWNTAEIQKRPKWILLLAGIVGMLLAGVGLYFLLIERPTPLVTKPPVTESSKEEHAPPLEEILGMQISIREIQEEIAQSHSRANGVDAGRRAPLLYQQAADWEKSGLAAIREGEDLINQRSYEKAAIRFQEAKALLTRAGDAFVRATEASQKQMATEAASRVQPENPAKIPPLPKRAAEKPPTPEKKKPPAPPPQVAAPVIPPPAQISPEPPAEPVVPPSLPRPDMEVVGEILAKLKRAYEARDLAALRQISNMSEKRARMLEEQFREYSAVKIKIANFSLAPETATATIVITQLVDRKGDAVSPPKEWKQSGVVLRKEEGEWGKVLW
jgi:serine/threonine protein kinase